MQLENSNDHADQQIEKARALSAELTRLCRQHSEDTEVAIVGLARALGVTMAAGDLDVEQIERTLTLARAVAMNAAQHFHHGGLQ